LATGVSSFLWLVFAATAAAAYLLLDTFNGLIAFTAVTLFLRLFYGVNAQKRVNVAEAAAGQREDAKADEDDEVKALKRRVSELEQALDASAQSLAGAQRALNMARAVVEEAQQDMVAATHELRRAGRYPPPNPQNVLPAGASMESLLRCLP